MKDTLSKVLNYFKKMDKKKRNTLIVLVSLVIVIAIVVAVLVNQKTYTVLYSGMEQADAAQVMTLLGDMGVDAKAQGTDTILVASNDVDTIRLELASQGYPSSGLNYDIYKNASGLGVTDSEKKIYYQYQLQENLRKTIMQMDKVKDAVVNIDLGEDSSYVLSDNNKPPTASIMLKLKDNTKLDKSEVQAIAELVSKSISGLDTSNIQIVDSNMNLYTVGGGSDDSTGTADADTHLDLQNSVQSQLQQQVINLLNPIFGEGNVLAQVSVSLDFDKKVSQSVEYTQPQGNPNGIAVSMKELVEAISNNSSTSSGNVAGVSANGDASQYLSTLSSDPNAVYYDISKEVNYDVNQTTTQVENAQGQVQDLSVSIVLNSKNVDDYSDQVKSLISTAIGANTDKITVEMLPFTAGNASSSGSNSVTNAFDAQQKVVNSTQGQETLRTVILVIGALIVLIIILVIVKTLRRKPEDEAVVNGGFEYVADEEYIPQPLQKESMIFSKDDIKSDKEDNLSVLKEYASENPESVANLLRNWLNEE